METGEPTRPRRRYAWLPVSGPNRSNAGLWVVAAGHALNHTYSAAFFLLLPFIAKDLGLSFSQVGLLVGVRQLMSMMINLPAGMLVDVVGRRHLLMMVSLLAATLPYLVIGVTASFSLMLVAMGVVGVGLFLWHPAAITALSTLYPDRRGYGLALHELGANVGDTLAPLAAGFLLAILAWRQVLSVNAALGIPVVFLLLWLMRRLHNRDVADRPGGLSPRAYVGGMRALFRNASLMALAVVSGVRSMTQHGLTTFLPLYLVYDVKLPAPLIGLYLTVVQASGMVATPLAGTLSDRLGPKRVATAGMLTSSVVLLAVTLTGARALFVAVLALLGFFVYSMRPAVFRWAMGVAPREYEGTTVGTLFTAQALFSTVTPIVGGAIADRYGLAAVFYFIAGTVLVANLAVTAVPDLPRPTLAREPGGSIE